MLDIWTQNSHPKLSTAQRQKSCHLSPFVIASSGLQSINRHPKHRQPFYILTKKTRNNKPPNRQCIHDSNLPSPSQIIQINGATPTPSATRCSHRTPSPKDPITNPPSTGNLVWRGHRSHSVYGAGGGETFQLRSGAELAEFEG